MEFTKQKSNHCDDLLRMRLEQMLYQRHKLYQLAKKIGWLVVETQFERLYSEQAVSVSRFTGW